MKLIRPHHTILAMSILGLVACTGGVSVESQEGADESASGGGVPVAVSRKRAGGTGSAQASQGESASSDSTQGAGSATLEEAGDYFGLVVENGDSEPTCDASGVGRVIFVAVNTGATGTLKVCSVNGTTYSWENAYPASLVALNIQGATGPTGLAGADGADGADGAQGPAGPQGSAGVAGSAGAQGIAGPQGNQGPQGSAGTNGADGVDYHDRQRNRNRLSLDSNAAVTTTDQTAKTTIYLVPYGDGTIALYNGTSWNIRTVATARSVAVPATTDTNFDIFAYDNSGTVTLETVNWTNNTTRATALTETQGVRVKSGDSTRRYLGTGRTTSVSGEVEDSEAKRFLWNFENRVTRRVKYVNDTDYTANTAAIRGCNNSSSYRAGVVTGADGTRVDMFVMGDTGATFFTTVNFGIGLDTSTGATGVASARVNYSWGRGIGTDVFAISAGYHYFQCVEWVDSDANNTDIARVLLIGRISG